MSSLKPDYKFLEHFKAKASYIIFLIALYAIVSMFIQTFMKTPFLPGGRSSIEYLYIIGYTEKFGYGRLYTIFTMIALLLNTILGDMILAVKASIIIIFVIYFFSLYMLSSILSTKWYALTIVATAFLPIVSDIIFNGDYMLFTSLAFITLFLAGVYNFIHKTSKISLAMAATALALIPFSDPQLLSWVSILIFPTIFLCTILSDRKLLPHFILLATIYTATATFSITIFAGLKDITIWQSNPLAQLYSNMLISIVLIIAGALGLLSLYTRKLHRLLYAIILWLAASMVCSIFELKLLSFTILVLLALAPASLTYIKETFILKRSGDKDNVQYEIEVCLDKFVTILPTLLLIILLLLSIPSTIVLGDHKIVPPPRVNDIYDASSFLSQNVRDELIIAHPSLANWLLVYSNLKILPIIDDATFKTADLLTTTSFRMINPYMKVDDWEPFSAAKAPLIHVYDGRNFKPLVYVDDSYSRFLLIDSSGREFIESPYGAKFLSYMWNESNEDIILTMSFQTPGLIINKTISLAKGKPIVSIEYHAKVIKKNIIVKGLNINIYSLPMDILPQLEIIRYGATMVIENQKLKIEFEGNIYNILHDKTKNQRYVICSFNPINNTIIYGKVNIEALNLKPSSEKLWYSSFFDEAKKYVVSYVIIPREHQIFMEGALPYKINSLIIKDSFIKFTIKSWGNIFQEAPAYAQVLNETVQENERRILYRTAGLYIEKKFSTLDNLLNITYNVQPYKNNTQLILSTFSIWIDYGRYVFSEKISIKEKNVQLILDSGTFKINFFGNVSDIVLESHPEYGQMRILATFQLNPSIDTIGASIASDKKMIIQYNPTTRPSMKDNDEIIISMEGGMFEPVKKLKLYTIYKIKTP